jgi:2-oxoglutarate dehydrogenase dihydrolipoamide succinyltransferase (E2 component)
MKQDMLMPKMGESITEGTIIRWLKNVGDTVDKDEIILEISTDKVDSEIPTPVAGTLVEILANEGDTVEVGKVIARIDSEGKAASAPEPAKSEKKSPEPQKQTEKETAPAPKKEAPASPKPAPASAPAGEQSRFYSPVVLNIARTEGISNSELDQIDGTGVGGRVTKKDVLHYLDGRGTTAAAVAPAVLSAPAGISQDGVEIVPMDHIRKKIAEHMVHTVHTSPHVGLFIEVDMTNVVRIRERNKDAFKRKEGISLTYMPFISEAVTRVLKEFPYVNASLDGDNILLKRYINLGIAVATEQGLIVPVIKNAEGLNITGLARAINDLATRARDRKLKPDEVSGGTFSISNFGVYGTTIGFPLINQPQVAIMGVGALQNRAVVINDAIAIRPMMNISLTFDHRLIDGALGAQFLQQVAEKLKNYDPGLTL